MSLNTSLGKILLESRWDELKSLRAEIGVAILIGVAMFFGILTLICGWVWFALSFLLTRGGIPSPFALCSFVGMALYISGRRSFLKRRSGERNTALLLGILGLALTVESIIEGLFVSLIWVWAGTYSPLPLEELIIYAFALAIYSLAFGFGVLLLSDQGKILEDKRRYPPSPQRLDVETQTKYPSDLFARYVRQYPHNPEGVLEWHIHKKMKEGKTREQAIKELMHALLH